MRFRQLVLFNILGIIVIVGLLIAGYVYYYNQNNYVSTNDASIQVHAASVNAMASGKLTDWSVSNGSNVSKGEQIGQETLPTGQTLAITSPIDGQVLEENAVSGEVVAPGTVLAEIANLADEYVVANVPETAIRHVSVGQSVDIYVDAYPGTSFSGVVKNIGTVAAAYSSIIPSSQASGNYTKQVQRVPVDITLSGNEGKLVLPAMNASVRIHRNNQ